MVFCGGEAALAAAPERKTLVARPRGDAVVRIDGRLTEPVWATAPVGTDFVERSPSPGARAPAGHEVRILYDEDAIYVGVRMPLDASVREQPRALELTRDSTNIFSDDAVSIKVDVRRDRRTTVGFVINAAGTQVDYLALENGQQFRREFDAVWEAEATVEADAWYAEFRLPVAALGLPDGRGERIIGLNVTRDHSLRAATYDWSGVPPEFGAFAALYYADVRGVQSVGGGRPLVLLPYVLGGYQTEGIDRIDDVDRSGNFAFGGDIQLRILDDLWSELTINPDFAQVDLDDPVVNFDRFPLFFPERRPFFLTGLQVFDFGVRGVSQLFFSRRIGLDDRGDEIPVLTGFKLYGTEGPWQLGMFQVFTGRDGEERAASWSIARLRRNFGEVAHLGVLGTLTGDVALLDGRSVPFSPKGSLGVDGSLRLVDRRLVFTGFWAYANNEIAEAPNDEGHSSRLEVSWQGEYLLPSVSVLLVENDFDPAVGFVRRQGIVQVDTELQYVRRPAEDQDLRVTIGVSGQTVRAADRDENLGQSAELSADLRWRSGWSTGVDVSYVEDVVEAPFELFGRKTIEADRYRGTRASVSVFSPSVRNPAFDASYAVDTAFFGGVRHGPSLGGSVNFGPHVRLSTGSELSFTRFDDGFGAEAFTLNSRLTVAPSTRLTSDAIVQVNTIGEVGTGLFRVRWRYLPGSDLFFVSRYQLDYGEDRRHRFDLTVKLQYRYDLLL